MTLAVMFTVAILWVESQAADRNAESQAFSPKVLEYHQRAWKIREKFAVDQYRPLYHYLPPENWMNDTNGTTYWKGKYHLFY